MSKLALEVLSIRGLVEFKLDSWGIWSTGSLGVGYPCMDMTAAMMGRALPIAPLTNAEGLLIESVMAGLFRSCPDARRAAILYYQRRRPLDQIAGGSYDQACQLLDIVRDTVSKALFPGLDTESDQPYDSGMIPI